MKTKILLSFLIVFASWLNLNAQHHHATWAKHIDGHESSSFNNIVYDGEHMIVNGYWFLDASFEGIELPNFLSSNTLLVKMTTDGEIIWYATITGDGYETSFDMALDSENNIVVTGWSSSNEVVEINGEIVFETVNEWCSRSFVAKFSGEDGSLIWYKTFYSEWEYSGVNASRLTVDANDNIYVSGYYDSPFDVDGIEIPLTQEYYGNQVYLIKFNPDGDAEWGIHYDFVNGGEYGGWALIRSVVSDDASVYFGVEYSKPMIVNGDPLPHEGEFYWLAIIKVSQEDGEFQTVNAFGSEDGQGFSRMVVDQDGNLIAVGWFISNTGFSIGGITLNDYGDQDGFVAKFDSNLQAIWAKDMGSEYATRAFSVGVASDNRIFIGGGFDSYTPFYYNGQQVLQAEDPNSLGMFCVFIDSNSNFQKAFALNAMNANGRVEFGDAILLPDDVMYVVGSSMDSVNFVKNEFVYSDHAKAFVMRWDLPAANTQTESFANSAMAVFPNPSNGRINLTSEAMMLHADVYDLMGRLVQSIQLNDFSKELNLSNFNNGCYLLRVHTTEGIRSTRLQIIN